MADSSRHTKFENAFVVLRKLIVSAQALGISNNKDVVHLIKPFPVPVSASSSRGTEGRSLINLELVPWLLHQKYAQGS